MSHSINGLVIVKNDEIIEKLKKTEELFCMLNTPYLFIAKFENGENFDNEMGFFLHTLGIHHAVHVSTDYFGGLGEQKARLYQNVGERQYHFEHFRSINQALNRIGVVDTDELDAFDVVGLGTIRDYNDVVQLFNKQYKLFNMKMGTMDDLWESTIEIGRISENRQLENPVLKLTEELGEISAELLKMNGYKKTTTPYAECVANFKEECVDLMITLIDVMDKADMTREDLYKLFPEKLTKWKNKHLLEQ